MSEGSINKTIAATLDCLTFFFSFLVIFNTVQRNVLFYLKRISDFFFSSSDCFIGPLNLLTSLQALSQEHNPSSVFFVSPCGLFQTRFLSLKLVVANPYELFNIYKDMASNLPLTHVKH